MNEPSLSQKQSFYILDHSRDASVQLDERELGSPPLHRLRKRTNPGHSLSGILRDSRESGAGSPPSHIRIVLPRIKETQPVVKAAVPRKHLILETSTRSVAHPKSTKLSMQSVGKSVKSPLAYEDVFSSSLANLFAPSRVFKAPVKKMLGSKRKMSCVSTRSGRVNNII